MNSYQEPVSQLTFLGNNLDLLEAMFLESKSVDEVKTKLKNVFGEKVENSTSKAMLFILNDLQRRINSTIYMGFDMAWRDMSVCCDTCFEAVNTRHERGLIMREIDSFSTAVANAKASRRRFIVGEGSELREKLHDLRADCLLILAEESLDEADLSQNRWKLHEVEMAIKAVDLAWQRNDIFRQPVIIPLKGTWV